MPRSSQAPTVLGVGAILGAVFAGVGPLLPWITATGPFGVSLSKNGVDDGGDGLLSIGVAVVALLVATAILAGYRALWPGLVIAFCGLGVFAVAYANYDDVDDRIRTLERSSELVNAQRGTGLYLMGVASVLLFIVGLGMLISSDTDALAEARMRDDDQ